MTLNVTDNQHGRLSWQQLGFLLCRGAMKSNVLTRNAL